MIRPRPGDLEAATHQHVAVPSGEHSGRNRVEVCDLCGLASTNKLMHVETQEQAWNPHA